jgi:hypothetical protein
MNRSIIWQVPSVLVIVAMLGLLTGCASNQGLKDSVAMTRANNDRLAEQNAQHWQTLAQVRKDNHDGWVKSLPKEERIQVIASERQTEHESQVNTWKTGWSILKAFSNSLKPDVYIDNR